MRELAPGAEIQVLTIGAPPRSRHFAMANESTIIALNLTDPALPPSAVRGLRAMAADHPEYFAAVLTSGTFAEGDLRIGREGLFVRDRKVANLDEVVERMVRNDISEIRGPVVARGSVFGTILGGWLGFAAGAVPALGGAPEGVAWLALAGAVTAGAYLGHHWSSHETEDIVYRAP